MKLKLAEIRLEGNVRADLGDLTDLVSSVKTHGVLEPLVVRKNGKGYILLAGHRRFAAAKKAGLIEVPVHEVSIPAGDDAAVQLAENLHRKDLTPMEVSLAIGKELQRRGFTLDNQQVIPAGLDEVAQEIAQKTGAKLAYIKGMARLVFLPTWAKKLMEQDSLTVPQALRILQLTPENREDLPKKFFALQDLKPGSCVQTSELERFIERSYGKDLSKAPFPLDEPVGLNIPCLTCEFNASNTAELFPGAGGSICRKSECYRSKCQTVSGELKEATLKENKAAKFLGYIGDLDRYEAGTVKEHKLSTKGNAFFILRGAEGRKPKVLWTWVKTTKEGKVEKPKEQKTQGPNLVKDAIDNVRRELFAEVVHPPVVAAINKVKLSVAEIAVFLVNAGISTDSFKAVSVGTKKGEKYSLKGLTIEDLGKAALFSAWENDDEDAQRLVKVDEDKLLAFIKPRIEAVKDELPKMVTTQYGYTQWAPGATDALVSYAKGGPLKWTPKEQPKQEPEPDEDDGQ